MKRATILITAACAAVSLAACGSEIVEDKRSESGVSSENNPSATKPAPAAAYDGSVAKPGSPYRISYRIIGTPIVGSPLTIELHVESALEPRPMTLDYRINDAAAMVLAESQLNSVRLEPSTGEKFFTQQVTIIPQREGRSYLNISASFETDEGMRSTVTAIPIQVGSGGRELQQNGELQVDENGEAIRVLTPE